MACKHYEILVLSEKWVQRLLNFPEKAIGLMVGRVKTGDGRTYVAPIFEVDTIFYVEGFADVPFGEIDIEDITITNEDFDYPACRKRGDALWQRGILVGSGLKQESVAVQGG